MADGTEARPTEGAEDAATPGTTVRVYEYGLRPPTEGAERVRAQLAAAHRYRNTLVEIERARRAAVRELEAASGLRAALDDVDAAAKLSETAYAAVRAHRGTERTRKVPPALAAALTAARAAEKEARTALTAKRKELRERADYVAARARLDATALDLAKNARANCGVFWGTYLLVEQAHEQACKATPLWEFAAPKDPPFVRWTGEGAVGVQLQGGRTVAEIAADTQVRLDDAPLAPGADPASRRSQTRPRKFLSLRVGSEGRAPVWATFPMEMHRPFPPGARVKRVDVHVRRIGPRERWTVKFTVEIPKPDARCGAGIVAVHLGWRGVADGVRVATYRGDGMAEAAEVRLDAAMLARMDRPDELRGTRDRLFNEARAAFVALLKRPGADVPDGVRERGKTAHAWRSPGRLAALVRGWARDAGLRVSRADTAD